MDFVITKNNMVDLNVFFYKKGMTNIHRPILSLLKIDSSKQADAFFHIGFKQNMGYSSSNPILSGIMIFEVLEGYPLQSILFTNNSTYGKPYKQSLEELDPMDFYCIQKRNEDPWGDFVLKNVKFIDTKYNQSIDEFSRRIVATFVAESKEAFRIPFFFNYFKSDIYSNHIVRNKSEIDNINKDIDKSWNLLTKNQKIECLKQLNEKELKINDIGFVKENVLNTWKKIVMDLVLGKNNKTPSSPVYKMRDFIASFYKYANEINYKGALIRGDLDFLKFIELDTSSITTNSDRELLNELVKNKNDTNEPNVKFGKKSNENIIRNKPKNKLVFNYLDKKGIKNVITNNLNSLNK